VEGTGTILINGTVRCAGRLCYYGQTPLRQSDGKKPKLELPGFVLKSIGHVLIRKKSFLGFKVYPLSSIQVSIYLSWATAWFCWLSPLNHTGLEQQT
jgi:hypothetical protein